TEVSHRIRLDAGHVFAKKSWIVQSGTELIQAVLVKVHDRDLVPIRILAIEFAEDFDIESQRLRHGKRQDSGAVNRIVVPPDLMQPTDALPEPFLDFGLLTVLGEQADVGLARLVPLSKLLESLRLLSRWISRHGVPVACGGHRPNPGGDCSEPVCR